MFQSAWSDVAINPHPPVSALPHHCVVATESVGHPNVCRWLPEQYALESVQTGHNTASGNLPVSVDPVVQSPDSVRHVQARY